MSSKLLIDWINEQLKEKGWSQSELAKRSGASRSLISQVLSGDMPPSAEFCLRIAKALGESPEKAFRLAGLLPRILGNEDKQMAKELIEIFENLSPEDRQDVLDFARFRYQKKKPG